MSEQLPLPPWRTGVRIHCARTGTVILVDDDAGLITLDITDDAGRRALATINPPEATRLAHVLTEHVRRGRY